MNLKTITESISRDDAARNIYCLERTPLSQVSAEFQAYVHATTDVLMYTERLLNTLMFHVRASGTAPLNLITERWLLHTTYVSKVFTGMESHNWVTWRLYVSRFLEVLRTSPIKEEKAEALAHDVACWCVMMDGFNKEYDSQYICGEVDQVIELAVEVVNKLSNGNLESIAIPRSKY